MRHLVAIASLLLLTLAGCWPSDCPYVSTPFLVALDGGTGLVRVQRGEDGGLILGPGICYAACDYERDRIHFQVQYTCREAVKAEGFLECSAPEHCR